MIGYYIFGLVVAATGVGLFIVWLVKTNFGTKALEDAKLRQNSMPDYLPLAVIFGWLGLYAAVSNLTENFTSKMPGWQQKFISYSVLIAINTIIAVFIILSARRYFEAGLKGFGLRVKGIFRDIAMAAAMFIAVWPLVYVSLYIILLIGRIIVGPEFQMEQNDGLTVILEYNQLSLRILMIFFAAVLIPIFEELVFRGLLQNYMRNLNYGPWQSIFIISIIFSVLHPLMHFPAILILSVCMGYAYEKSGSLLRSIFIHIFFNASTIALALLR